MARAFKAKFEESAGTILKEKPEEQGGDRVNSEETETELIQTKEAI